MNAPLLNADLAQKLNSFHVLWIRYNKAYHTVLGTLEDKKIRLKINKYWESDEIELNEDVLLYIDQAIRFLEFVKKSSLIPELESNNWPFVHRLLRKWRNINHHEEYLPFRLTSTIDGKLKSDGTQKKAEDYPQNFYLYGIIVAHNGLSEIAKDHDRFSASKVTLGDLIIVHHNFMYEMLAVAEKHLNMKLPEKFSVAYSIGGFSFPLREEKGKKILPPAEYLDFSSFLKSLNGKDTNN